MVVVGPQSVYSVLWLWACAGPQAYTKQGSAQSSSSLLAVVALRFVNRMISPQILIGDPAFLRGYPAAKIAVLGCRVFKLKYSSSLLSVSKRLKSRLNAEADKDREPASEQSSVCRQGPRASDRHGILCARLIQRDLKGGFWRGVSRDWREHRETSLR